MPGAVVTATPSGVLPHPLFTKYALQIQRRANVNEYLDGTTQAAALVGAERRRWDLEQRLTAALLADLETFFEDHNGKQIPFYFYDTTIPGTVYDATGVATTGRVAVTFDTDSYSHTLSPGRASSPFALIEVG